MSQTKERPILFSAPMVRAILEGRKTQTRRVVKLQTEPTDYPQADGVKFVKIAGKQYWWNSQPAHPAHVTKACPYGQPGDRLWVRETHMLGLDPDIQVGAVAYKADGYVRGGLGDFELQQWRPSIHMPRWASRILLEVTAVRVERLQDISEADAIAEGTPGGHGAIPGYGYAATPGEHYHWLWESINGAGSWDANPWVWVVEFKQLKGGAA